MIRSGIGHDHGMVLGSPQRLHSFVVGTAGLVDVLCHRCGADKTDRCHLGVLEQAVDRLPVAIDNVEHTVRHTGFVKELGQPQTARRDPSRKA